MALAGARRSALGGLAAPLLEFGREHPHGRLIRAKLARSRVNF
jgi:hypothetical protein